MNYNNIESLEFIANHIENNPQLFSKTYSTLYNKALQNFKENKSSTDTTYLSGPYYGILMISLMNMEIYQKGEQQWDFKI